MVTVRLPDGKTLQFDDGVQISDVIRRIGPGLARDAIAAKIDGETRDLVSRLSAGEFSINVLTPKADNADALAVMRHSCAHVMAEAICSLWPQTKLVYGPSVENGFYYDIDLDHAISPGDFGKIETRMREIVKEDRPFTRYEMARVEAMGKLSREGNKYKVDNAERAEGDVLSFYVTGAAGSGCFEDLCRGPHVPSTGRVGAFKIMQVAGAYWHGDATKGMLQRVYGTAWPNEKDLKSHLDQMEEAKKRDHRKLGTELGLFTIDNMVGQGLILWKPRGAIVRHTLETFLRDELLKRGYQPVYTPHVGRLELYRTSRHFPYYKDSQFPPIYESEKARHLNLLWEVARATNGATASAAEVDLFERLAAEHADLKGAGYPVSAPVEERLKRIRSWLSQEDGFLLKPMNCPHHIRIFGSEPRSYKDLPIRLAEFGTVYRFEQSGELSGMVRVRGFTQDDAHIFCTPDQLAEELSSCTELTKLVLDTLGLKDYRVRLGYRDPKSDKFIGAPEAWDKAEAAVRRAAEAAELPFTEGVGDAAFYGPKIDFLVKDCIGREWQLGTVQADYFQPENFDLKYIGSDNAEHRPVMVHRAPFGSFERFVGILIEHFKGAFPLWLSPVQAIVCTVSEKSHSYAMEVFETIRKGLRAEFDGSGERIGNKIRQATLMKIPYILVIGEQEAANQTINVRTRDGKQLGSCQLSQFLTACAEEIITRRL